jgi:hypothetical protein
MRTLLLLAAMLFVSPVMAELKLQINGPAEGKTGDLVVLDSTGTIANGKDWIVPKELQGKTLSSGCSDQLGFATRNPGKYTFHLYGTDGLMLAHVSHEVTITGLSTEPPPTTDPPPVDPPPIGNFESLKKTSYEKSIALNDQKTRTQLGQTLSQGKLEGSLSQAQDTAEKRITLVLSKRTRDSQDSDWFNGWYVPILTMIQEMNRAGKITTVDQYNEAIKAVAEGLMQSGSTEKRTSVRQNQIESITMYSIPNCPACDRFLIEEQPNLTGLIGNHRFEQVKLNGTEKMGNYQFPLFVIRPVGKNSVVVDSKTKVTAQSIASMFPQPTR